MCTEVLMRRFDGTMGVICIAFDLHTAVVIDLSTRGEIHVFDLI